MTTDTIPNHSPDVAAEIIAGHGRSLSQAARLFPSYRMARPVAPSTVYRWIADGVQAPDGSRVRLEAVRLGGRWLTSTQAIERFIASQTPSLEAVAGPTRRTPTQRAKGAERAGRELEKVGI
jgi:hypothetical protein